MTTNDSTLVRRLLRIWTPSKSLLLNTIFMSMFATGGFTGLTLGGVLDGVLSGVATMVTALVAWLSFTLAIVCAKVYAKLYRVSQGTVLALTTRGGGFTALRYEVLIKGTCFVGTTTRSWVTVYDSTYRSLRVGDFFSADSEPTLVVDTKTAQPAETRKVTGWGAEM